MRLGIDVGDHSGVSTVDFMERYVEGFFFCCSVLEGFDANHTI